MIYVRTGQPSTMEYNQRLTANNREKSLQKITVWNRGSTPSNPFTELVKKLSFFFCRLHKSTTAASNDELKTEFRCTPGSVFSLVYVCMHWQHAWLAHYGKLLLHVITLVSPSHYLYMLAACFHSFIVYTAAELQGKAWRWAPARWPLSDSGAETPSGHLHVYIYTKKMWGLITIPFYPLIQIWILYVVLLQ